MKLRLIGVLVDHQLRMFALPCAATPNLVMRACLLLQNGRRKRHSQQLVFFFRGPLCDWRCVPHSQAFVVEQENTSQDMVSYFFDRETSETCSVRGAGVAAGAHGLPAGRRGPARAVEHGLDAQPLTRGLRVVPGQEPAAALAVGPQALLGRAAGCRPRVRRARLAVRVRLPGGCAQAWGREGMCRAYRGLCPGSGASSTTGTRSWTPTSSPTRSAGSMCPAAWRVRAGVGPGGHA